MTARLTLHFLIVTHLVGRSLGEPIVENELREHFSSRGLTGCFVLLNVQESSTHVWNLDRAKKRFRPASTFKIPNAIIGLEVKAVGGIDEVISYGGTKELMPAWEKDMHLRDAMKVSNVAVFHQLAKEKD